MMNKDRVDDSSESEDDEDFNFWNFKTKKCKKEDPAPDVNVRNSPTLNKGLSDKFKDLQNKRIQMSANTKRRRDLTDARIIAKKAKKSNSEKEVTEEVAQDSAKEEWTAVKSYLNVNEHLHGPVKHGKYGPKTELEQKIDDALDEGDFDEAEILSDNLANREFASKINSAFAAKKYAEKKSQEDEMKKKKQMKKLYWGFEMKNRWEMKGNM